MPKIEFCPLQAADLPMLTAWLAEPHVRKFYQKHPVTFAEVALEYGPTIRAEEPSLSHVASYEDTPFAYLQCYRNVDYPEWQALIGVDGGISVDLYIGDPAYLHRGLGRSILRAYLARVAFPSFPHEAQAYIGHDLLNTAALRCSQAAGFRPLRGFLEDGNEMALFVIEKTEVHAA
jgi:aminoglycoside 6'-N-acetyltransferase